MPDLNGERRCSRCKEWKKVECFPPTHCYCNPCFAAYNRDRAAKRKKFKAEFAKQPLTPLDPPKVRKKPGPKPKPKPVKLPKPKVRLKAAPKPITVVVPDKPKRRGHNRKYIDLIQPAPPPPLKGTETVEQFLARGGQIERVAIGATGYKL